MKLLNDLLELKKKIYEYFGYEANWCEFPFCDSLEYYWTLGDYNVSFCKDRDQIVNQDESGEYYDNELITDSLCSTAPSVYRGADYTMMIVDTHCDGNKYLQIFANNKEVKESELKEF